MNSHALAIHGGEPVRTSMIPYGRQTIDQDDIQAVSNALTSDFLTTGSRVAEFENAFATFTKASHAVAVSNGTTALHAITHALDIKPGDEVIVPCITFVATANAVVMQGGTPIFADVEDGSLLIDPQDVEKKITSRTKAVIAVDYAGQPCDYDALQAVCDSHAISLLSDACHSVGATYKNRSVGTLAEATAFSFHPVKPITTGEGGMITTENAEWAENMRRFRNHGISKSAEKRQQEDTWIFTIDHLGYNYRLTDFQCVLGMSQLHKLPHWVTRRQEIAKQYDKAFGELEGVEPLQQYKDRTNGYHLYVVRFDKSKIGVGREMIFKALRAEGIGVNVHYIPVHLHQFYQSRFQTRKGTCPIGEQAYEEIITLPLFVGMKDDDVNDVIRAVQKVCAHAHEI